MKSICVSYYVSKFTLIAESYYPFGFVYISLNSLQFTSTYVDLKSYMNYNSAKKANRGL